MYKITASGATFPASELGMRFPHASLPAQLSQSDRDHLGIELVPDPLPTPPTADELVAQAEAARIAAIPYAVSPRQIRQALTRAGLRAGVEAAVAASDQDTKDWYEFATEFLRSHPEVQALGAVLGVTPRQLDDLWTLAGAL